MYSASSSVAQSGQTSWFSRGEAWLDERGKKAWIAAMIVSFIFFWPVGLAILAYMIWSKRMFSRSHCGSRSERRSRHIAFARASSSSGNSAFDSYKAEMLRRLETEQTAFETFLQRLRDAKDKSEFDAFMDDRAKASAAEASGGPKAGEY
jgi:uncharacterized membrane protein YgcG